MSIKLYKAVLPIRTLNYNYVADWDNMPIGMKSATIRNERETECQKFYITILEDNIVIVKNPNLITRLLAKRVGAINKGYNSAPRISIEELKLVKQLLKGSENNDAEILINSSAPNNKKLKK